MDWAKVFQTWFAVTIFNIFVLGLGIHLLRESIKSIKRKGGIRNFISHSISRSTWYRLWND
ncbi:hypothetical protein H8R29_23735 [Priestia megaterium]|uniref:Uncharacterized protein n=1 Tax=Priestia megaterium (strain ATCC 14581 / DSM 32 / CCUG 1817 / JCM 2506 / NBRC 15308 / NCIMB 9376 / NCTC 10342 / NRRL B-14308 / VKM B-512 / Ford 19) TaxID=1348623 RepID=A0A0B6AFW1_PRIM2|nr:MULTISPECIES: hypothetical protein [Priestia]AJI23790.1 hypothetical protein BG04_1477 [Priestia megaterium NBRC 15308 = ATCC 14581]MDR4230423.1 hypothetical protein [Priestia megaterium]MED3805571.1 hypothetical protein [Priestia megaterium]MED3888183.1 hypothetical protein [Priestia aryabhattai]MED4257732.1 hypothetical protein [Priestia aryabhattai]